MRYRNARSYFVDYRSFSREQDALSDHQLYGKALRVHCRTCSKLRLSAIFAAKPFACLDRVVTRRPHVLRIASGRGRETQPIARRHIGRIPNVKRRLAIALTQQWLDLKKWPMHMKVYR